MVLILDDSFGHDDIVTASEVLDVQVRVLASFVQHFLRQGVKTSVWLGNHFVSLGAGVGSINEFLDSLAMLELRNDKSAIAPLVRQKHVVRIGHGKTEFEEQALLNVMVGVLENAAGTKPESRYQVCKIETTAALESIGDHIALNWRQTNATLPI
ncbi:MAG: hypothetical protein R3C03_23240 [Pirellulaceae bacterium]